MNNKDIAKPVIIIKSQEEIKSLLKNEGMKEV